MRGIQNDINSLVMAFRAKDIIIKINTKQVYSIKYKKTFTSFELKENSIKELKLLAKLREKKARLKEIKKDKTKADEIDKLEKETNILKEKTDKMYIPKREFRNKVDMLVYLADRYKGVDNNE